MEPDSIAKLVKHIGGKRPISITITNTFSPKTCNVFMPAATLLSAVGLDVRRLEAVWKQNQQELEKAKQGAKRLQRDRKLARNSETVNQDSDVDELVSLMNDQDLDSEEDAEDRINGVQNEVDMFMARGGYQVTYIGSLSVSISSATFSFHNFMVKGCVLIKKLAQIDHATLYVISINCGVSFDFKYFNISLAGGKVW